MYNPNIHTLSNETTYMQTNDKVKMQRHKHLI